MAYANKQLNTLAPLPIPIPSGGIQVQLNTLAEGAPRAAWATQKTEAWPWPRRSSRRPGKEGHESCSKYDNVRPGLPRCRDAVMSDSWTSGRSGVGLAAYEAER